MMAIVVASVFFSIRCHRWFVCMLLHIAVARPMSHFPAFSNMSGIVTWDIAGGCDAGFDSASGIGFGAAAGDDGWSAIVGCGE